MKAAKDNMTFNNQLDLNEEQTKAFIKENLTKHYISEKPKRQQLFFLFKLILNRRGFEFKFREMVLLEISKFLCCCKKRLTSTSRFKEAKSRERSFDKGNKRLTKDLDIVSLVKNI